MPFIVLPPTPVDIPRTTLEYVQSESNLLDVAPVLKNLRLDEDFFENVYLKDKFANLYKAWITNTRLQSSVFSIIEDNNFKRIIEMGEKAIPLIIEEIDKNPSTLVWALNIITSTTISSTQRLTVTEACRRWVKIWKDKNTAKLIS
jgi:hypothetical protein